MSARIVDHAAARRAAVIAGVWAPLAIIAAAELVMLLVGPSLGPEVVAHWGVDGPDRIGPWWGYPVMVAAIGVPLVGLLAVLTLRASRVTGMSTWLPAIAIGMTVFLSLGVGVGALLLNATPLAPALPLGAGAALGVIAGLATWLALPREASPHEVVPVAPLPLRPGEVAVWAGRVAPPVRLVVAAASVAVALAAIGIVLVALAGWRSWPVFLVPIVVVVALLTTVDWRVSAGPAGFVARSALGWPVIRVPAAEIRSAGVVTVDPMSDFGGWGIRWAPGPVGRRGRTGVISRSGEALEVVRTDGRSVVVTVDGAAVAAAVLAAAQSPASG